MVYVTQEQEGKNILSALKYGEIKILLPPGMQVTFSVGQVVKKLYVELSNFNDADYLLLIGDPVAIAIAAMIASNWNNGKIKVLKWDRQEKIYFPIEIELFNKNSNEEFFKKQ